jgi:hypothetical protein
MSTDLEKRIADALDRLEECADVTGAAYDTGPYPQFDRARAEIVLAQLLGAARAESTLLRVALRQIAEAHSCGDECAEHMKAIAEAVLKL